MGWRNGKQHVSILPHESGEGFGLDPLSKILDCDDKELKATWDNKRRSEQVDCLLGKWPCPLHGDELMLGSSHYLHIQLVFQAFLDEIRDV